MQVFNGYAKADVRQRLEVLAFAPDNPSRLEAGGKALPRFAVPRAVGALLRYNS
jgi:hypothetical protein